MSVSPRRRYDWRCRAQVYEFAVFDGLEHVRFASLPGMWDRTVSVHSAGKTFSCTGWRVGYMIAPTHLTTPLIKSQGIIAFAGATPLEVAVAVAFERGQAEGYFDAYSLSMQGKRDLLVAGLEAAGLQPIVPQGGYFTVVETDALAGALPPGALEDNGSGPELALAARRDYQVAVALSAHAGVTGIPPCIFYQPEFRHLADGTLRFAHCKEDAELHEASARLQRFMAA